MNNVNQNKTPNIKIVKQYIKDLSFESFKKPGDKDLNVSKPKITVEMKAIYEPYDNDFYGVTVTYNVKGEESFYLELDYYGFFKIENIKNYSQDILTSEAIKFIFPFVRAIIAQITQNGGTLPVLLENVSFNLIKS